MDSGVCAGTAYFLISVLLPKALNDQGFAVNASLALTSIVYAESFSGKGFTGTIFVVVAIGAFIPLAFGRGTVGQLEMVTEGKAVPAPA